MELTQNQKQELYHNGFVKLPGAVPPGLVQEALRAINTNLGEKGIDPARLATFRAQSFCPELQTDPVITNLLNKSVLWSLAESAIGRGEISPVTSGQIALRFPGPGPARINTPHIDGMHTPTNGVPAGEIYNFTALIGVFLSDIPHEFMGNFSVWPGTHRIYEEYFRKEGPQSLLNGMPRVDLPEPQQVIAQAGDAALVHYQLGHSIAANVSPYTRYGIFFRLKHKNHAQWHWECMTDIWREWAGMHDIVASIHA